jgi:excisionase family DNA binding protein
MENYVTVKQLAERFAVTRTTVYRWLTDGSLPCTRLGGAIRFSQENIEQFIKNSEQQRDRACDKAMVQA